MRPRPATRPSAIALLAALLISTLLVACGGQASAPGGDDGAAAPPAEVDTGGGELPDASAPADLDDGERSLGQEGPDAAPIEQRIIKTGEIGLEVDNVAAILARVRGMAVDLGGYVGSSQAGTLEESASLTLRVPATRFDELIARLHELEDVDVVSESTREQDVTREIVDLEARIRNLEASEESYRVLLERAEEVEDILSVQSRLDQVRGQIEQLEAQLQTVEGQADLSTLTITLFPRAQPVEAAQAAWDPGAQLESALAAVVGIGQGLLDALIWFAIVWLPILLLLAFLGLVALRGWLELRRRLPTEPVARETEPMR